MIPISADEKIKHHHISLGDLRAESMLSTALSGESAVQSFPSNPVMQRNELTRTVVNLEELISAQKLPEYATKWLADDRQLLASVGEEDPAAAKAAASGFNALGPMWRVPVMFGTYGAKGCSGEGFTTRITGGLITVDDHSPGASRSHVVQQASLSGNSARLTFQPDSPTAPSTGTMTVIGRAHLILTLGDTKKELYRCDTLEDGTELKLVPVVDQAKRQAKLEQDALAFRNICQSGVLGESRDCACMETKFRQLHDVDPTADGSTIAGQVPLNICFDEEKTKMVATNQCTELYKLMFPNDIRRLCACYAEKLVQKERVSANRTLGGDVSERNLAMNSCRISLGVK